MARRDPRKLMLAALALATAPDVAMATTRAAATHAAGTPVAAAPALPTRIAPRHAPVASPAPRHIAAHAASAPSRHTAAQAQVAAADAEPPRARVAAYAAPVGAQGWNRGWHGESRYDWAGWRASHRETYRLGYYYPPLGDYAYAPVGNDTPLDAAFMAEQFWIADPSIYHLPPVWGPYRWVRYYNDALLVDIDTGQIIDVVRAIFL